MNDYNSNNKMRFHRAWQSPLHNWAESTLQVPHSLNNNMLAVRWVIWYLAWSGWFYVSDIGCPPGDCKYMPVGEIVFLKLCSRTQLLSFVRSSLRNYKNVVNNDNENHLKTSLFYHLWLCLGIGLFVGVCEQGVVFWSSVVIVCEHNWFVVRVCEQGFVSLRTMWEQCDHGCVFL